jgi:hypothetical protein
MGRVPSTNEKKRNAYGPLVGRLEETTRLPRSKCEDNIETDLKEIGWDDGLDSSG